MKMPPLFPFLRLTFGPSGVVMTRVLPTRVPPPRGRSGARWGCRSAGASAWGWGENQTQQPTAGWGRRPCGSTRAEWRKVAAESASPALLGRQPGQVFGGSGWSSPPSLQPGHRASSGLHPDLPRHTHFMPVKRQHKKAEQPAPSLGVECSLQPGIFFYQRIMEHKIIQQSGWAGAQCGSPARWAGCRAGRAAQPRRTISLECRARPQPSPDPAARGPVSK